MTKETVHPGDVFIPPSGGATSRVHAVDRRAKRPAAELISSTDGYFTWVPVAELLTNWTKQ